jgi:hypothetical protein
MPPEWVAGFHGTNGVHRITGALDTEVLVFATDGGGNMFGLRLPEGRTVYSMPTGGVRDGVFETEQLHSPDLLRVQGGRGKTFTGFCIWSASS